MTILRVHGGHGLASVIREKGKGFSWFWIRAARDTGCLCYPYHWPAVVFLSVVFLLLVACHVEFLPARSMDDGFDRYVLQERSTVYPTHSPTTEHHSISGNHLELMTPGVYNPLWQEWNPKQVTSEIRMHRLTWLLVVSSWCPHARQDVIRWQSLRHRLIDAGIGSLVLSVDYDRTFVESLQREEEGSACVGVVSVDDFHSDQLEKCNRFQYALFPTCPPGNGLPRHYLVDSTGTLITWHFGELYDPGAFLNTEALE